MKVALVNVINRTKNLAMNKDLAGGFGTASDFGTSITSKLLTLAKSRTVRLPIIAFAYLQGIFNQTGGQVEYFEGTLPSTHFDIILLYGSIVDYKNENRVCAKLKEMNPDSKAGFFGPFPSLKPELFDSGDFVLKGEAESFFLYQFRDVEQMVGVVQVDKLTELDDLPTPCFDGFPISTYTYFPAIKEKPFLVLQASRGCPYTCGYYCPYAANQGSRYRVRSVANLAKDFESLVHRYNVKGVQFRDPTFGINRQQVEELCRLLVERKIGVKWGIETRTDLLDEELLNIMFDAGLRNINIGVETSDHDVAQANRRKLTESKHQEAIILYCKKKGIKVSAFYILGLKNDTEETIRRTIDYALKLNTNVAQFTISTPYPGTDYYDELRKEGKLLIDEDLEKCDGNRVIFKHDHLTEEELLRFREMTFRKYYFRPSYIWELLKWRFS